MKSPLRMFKQLFLAFVFSEKQHPFPAAFLLVFFNSVCLYLVQIKHTFAEPQEENERRFI